MAGQQYDVLLAGSDGWGIEVLDNLLANATAVFHQVHYRDIFVACGYLRRLIAARFGERAFEVHCLGVHLCIRLEVKLLDGGAYGRSEVLVLGSEGEIAAGGEDAFPLLDLAGCCTDEFEFLFHAEVERIALVRRLPAIVVRGYGSKFNGARFEPGIGACHGYRFSSDAGDFFRRHEGGGSEAPPAIGDNTHTETERSAIGHKRHFQDLAGS